MQKIKINNLYNITAATTQDEPTTATAARNTATIWQTFKANKKKYINKKWEIWLNENPLFALK